MLTRERLSDLLSQMSALRILVVGDLFLDRYLEIERSLAEISLETGLEAHQVTEVRASPGAGGNVVANVRALGPQVGVVSIIGDDGEGYLLRRCLEELHVDMAGLVVASDRFTPTYTKPMMHEPDGRVHELSRLDICNRTPTPARWELRAIEAFRDVAADADGVLVADQVTGDELGVMTTGLREAVIENARVASDRPYLVDSRMRLGRYRHLMLKPNVAEALRALGRAAEGAVSLEEAGAAGVELARRGGRTVFLTVGESGVLVCDGERAQRVPAVPVRGEIDVVGAGDTTIAAIGAALCAGATSLEAAEIGNLAASVTIQCIGTTGTASPEQILKAWEQRFR